MIADDEAPVARTYPEGSPPLVEFVLLAEFDIKSGSTLRHAYPGRVDEMEDDWFAEHMLPEGAHGRASDFTVFFLRRSAPGLQEQLDTPGGPDAGSDGGPDGGPDGRRPFLYCLNVLKTVRDSSVDRGAVLKSLAICSPYHFVDGFRAAAVAALDAYFADPDPSVLQSLHAALNGIAPSSLPCPSPAERALMRRSAGVRAVGRAADAYRPSLFQHCAACDGGARPPLRLSLCRGPDEVLDARVGDLVRAFGEGGTVRILNAILGGERVLFVGYNQAAGDVCRFVLSACRMVSPPLVGLLRTRCFPYANLTDLSFLEVPGFVAGVTNPVFETNTEWWDLLCELHLHEGRGTVSSAEQRRDDRDKKSADHHHAHAPSDPARAEDKAGARDDARFAARIVAGAEEYGEEWMRKQFEAHAAALLRRAALGGGGADAAAARVEARPAQLRWIRDPWPREGACRGDARLRERLTECAEAVAGGGAAAPEEAEEAVRVLEGALRSEAQLQTLLMLLPEERGGLNALAAGLLSTAEGVRRCALALLERMERLDSTRPAVKGINRFLAMAMRRVQRELRQDAGGGGVPAPQGKAEELPDPSPPIEAEELPPASAER